MAIDGYGGSGKSTFTALLHGALLTAGVTPVTTVEADSADLAIILNGYSRPDLLAPVETLPRRLLLYQMLYALDGLWWQYSFHDEPAAERERQRLRRYAEALDRL